LRFARDLHDTVAQRLCGVALVLGSEWASVDEHQDLCRNEITSALAEMQRLIELNLCEDERPAASAATFELAKLRAEHSPDLVVSYPETLPALSGEIRRVLDVTLAEALRNATKHALPRTVTITVSTGNGTVRLEVENDGVAPRTARSLGLGIRLLELDASLQGGALESRAHGISSWLVRLTVPIGA
jgi:signal transduction histidine kinase